MANDNRFAARLRAIREQRGMSQESLAEILECSVDTVSNMERGHSVPKLTTIERLSDRLGLSIFDILDYLQRGHAPDPGRIEWETRLIDATRHLDARRLPLVLDLVEVLVRHAK
ncbi:MAG TPA: helix-turn-helix transcriptional regulator [Arenibaculum sp.]|nr:helix-turn-helix transcriptional regulator [Arenibaculum sp.]